MCRQLERNAIWIAVLCHLATLSCGVAWVMHGYDSDTLGPLMAWIAASTVWTTRLGRTRRGRKQR